MKRKLKKRPVKKVRRSIRRPKTLIKAARGKMLTLPEAVKKYGLETQRQKMDGIERIDDDYVKDGKSYTRLTSVLSVIEKPFLDRWYARQAAEVALKFKAMNSKFAVNAVMEKVALAGAEGSDFHNWVRFYLMGVNIDVDSLSPTNVLRVKRFLQYENREKHTTVFSERFAISESLGIGCTIDRLVRKKDGRLVLQDYKATNGVYWHHALQLAGQAKCLFDTKGVNVDGQEVLWCTPDFCVPIPVAESVAYLSSAKYLHTRLTSWSVKPSLKIKS